MSSLDSLDDTAVDRPSDTSGRSSEVVSEIDVSQLDREKAGFALRSIDTSLKGQDRYGSDSRNNGSVESKKDEEDVKCNHMASPSGITQYNLESHLEKLSLMAMEKAPLSPMKPVTFSPRLSMLSEASSDVTVDEEREEDEEPEVWGKVGLTGKRRVVVLKTQLKKARSDISALHKKLKEVMETMQAKERRHREDFQFVVQTFQRNYPA
mmetsp:Transcript_29106/g.48951  ORF Transcript_29106/g.48951 Transcript_29106/m.48951 type:complete len:209 (-) Transcript_29106:24-650(-)